MIHFIIDGYNMIGRQKGLRGDIASKRERLIEYLSYYRQATGHSITVVFDGWRTGREVGQMEVVGGVYVIYTRRGEKADSVIAQMVCEKAGKLGSMADDLDMVVVTSDRELRKIIVECGRSVLYAGEFEKRLDHVLQSRSPSGDISPPAR